MPAPRKNIFKPQHDIVAPPRGNGASPPVPPTDGELAVAIIQLSDAAGRLLRSGINKKALVVLLRAETKLPLKTINKVLDGLHGLSAKYCARAAR